MTQGERQSRYIDESEIKRLVRESMLSEEDVRKNLDQLARIIELFDEVDAFEEHVRELEPLYHPLDQKGEPREDVEKDNRVRLEEFTQNIRDRFLRAPRL